MSDTSLFLLGAAVGLVIGILGNVVVLPLVLRSQQARLADDWRMPVVGWSKPVLAQRTKLIYRLFLPPFFMLAGAKLAIDFGSPS